MVQHAQGIFATLGLAVEPVYLDFADGARSLAAGEVDAQFQCPIPNKVMTDLAARADLRVLPYAPGQLDAVMNAVAYYRPIVMRKGAIRGLSEDVAQIAVVNVLATHARISAQIFTGEILIVLHDPVGDGAHGRLVLGRHAASREHRQLTGEIRREECPVAGRHPRRCVVKDDVRDLCGFESGVHCPHDAGERIAPIDA